jgi:hypothetical protein
MSPQFQVVFARLRDLLRKRAEGFTVVHDTAGQYGLDAPVGPATVKAWGGKVKRRTIPVAWVQAGQTYVSFHLMGVYGNPKLLDGISAELRARMQGKSCFNFKAVDEALFQELEQLTLRSLTGMRKAGYISETVPTTSQQKCVEEISRRLPTKR